MKLRIVAVGAVKDRPTRGLIDVYAKRIKRYASFEEVEVKAGRGEEALLMRAVGASTLVAMDAAGKEFDSKGFAHQLERLASLGKGEVSFVIGGAAGLGPELRRAAQHTWSLSRLTFPHRLARLLLAEQLYRAMTIWRNEPYDK